MAEENIKSKPSENGKKNSSKDSNKKGVGITFYIFAVIASALIVAVGITQYRMFYFKKDIHQNIATVNTTALIQEFRLNSVESLKQNKQTSISKNELKNYLNDMQEIVDGMSKKYGVVLLEKGAVISKGFVDLTPELRKRMVDRGYEFLEE
ncbi:TrbI F-type domain-containing protein [Flexistipes sp.]|uniref:TrbI F-type domain-containing protein n=1 Tax=Flexistipes sp. TaxID=3088135 RepID=UPI002E1B7F53|nr:TrbI F-type domain-containing protein [Flexistipes sp.]